MRGKRFWPPTKHKLLYTNLIVYGVIIVLLFLFHRELIWAQKTLYGCLISNKFDPPAANLLMNKFLINSQTGKDAEMHHHLLEEAFKIDPYSHAPLLLGDYYVQRGNMDKALAYYDRFRSIDPAFLDVYIKMIEILEEKQSREAKDQLLAGGIKHFRWRVEHYQPRFDPSVSAVFNMKASRIHDMSREGLERLEKIQEQSEDPQ